MERLNRYDFDCGVVDQVSDGMYVKYEDVIKLMNGISNVIQGHDLSANGAKTKVFHDAGEEIVNAVANRDFDISDQVYSYFESLTV